MPTFRLATCRGISLPPMTRTSPKGMTAHTTRAGNSVAYPSILSAAAAACPHWDVTVLCYASKNKSDPTLTLPPIEGEGLSVAGDGTFSLSGVFYAQATV